MPPGVAAHVREATSSSVVAFTLTASSVTESARLLTQALNAVQALEPDDADRAFVAAYALERVAMRCLALRLDRVDKIARPSVQRGTSAFERAAMHAQASVRPPTQAELVASAFVRDSAALDTAARGALEDDERRRDALHAHDVCARLCAGDAEGFADAFRPADAASALRAVLALADMKDEELTEKASARRSSTVALGLLPALPLESLAPSPPPKTPPQKPSSDYASALSSVSKDEGNPHLLRRGSFDARPNRWGETVV